jgi:glycosyltransferase involved in cell wall biosynthesis
MVEVSVVIPVYNVEKYLKECLDSVCNQTFRDIEIICVNDGSTDSSPEILEDYAERDDRFKIISQRNKGLGAARNVGLNHCSGNYVYFIDSDDYIKVDMIEEMYNNAVSNKSDIVVSKISRFSDDSSEIDYSGPGYKFDEVFPDTDFDNFTFKYGDVKKYVLNSSFAPWMKLFRRDFIEVNNFRFLENTAFEDILFHVSSFLMAERISFSPNFFYFYRNNPNSIINTSDSGFDIFNIIHKVKDFLMDNGFYDEFKDEFDQFTVTQVLNFILTTESDEYFQKAKEEFEQIHLSQNHLLSDSSLKRYNLVLDSDSYFGYIKGHYEIVIQNYENNILNLEAKVDKLTKKNKKLSKKYKGLKSEIENNDSGSSVNKNSRKGFSSIFKR